jgi:hypothetical protein
MKKAILLGLCFLVFVLGTSCAQMQRQTPPSTEVRDVPFNARDEDGGALRKRVLVLPFLAEGPGGSAMSEEARRFFVQEMGRTHEFVIIDPADLSEDPKKFITEENQYNMDPVARMASGMGLAAVIEGKVLEVRARRLGDQVGLIREIRAEVTVKVRLRMIAARNGHEIFNEIREATAESSTTRVGEKVSSDAQLSSDPGLARVALNKAFAGALPGMSRAMDKLSWEGRVAMVNGERIYVNAGRLSGLQVGDILKVSEEGEEVFDPETGRFIGKAPGRLKGTLEVVAYFGKDGAIGVIHSGSGFKENDLVELY